MSREPSEPGHELGDRILAAVSRELAGETQLPRLVIMIELPPDGRINLISQGDDEVDTYRMLALAAAAARAAMKPAERARARAFWKAMDAGFESRS